MSKIYNACTVNLPMFFYLTSHRLGKEQCDIGQQSLFNFQRPLTAYFVRHEDAQNSTLTFNQLLNCLSAQLRAVNNPNRFGASKLVAPNEQSVA
jgi:hypothetical protein